MSGEGCDWVDMNVGDGLRKYGTIPDAVAELVRNAISANSAADDSAGGPSESDSDAEDLLRVENNNICITDRGTGLSGI